MQGSQPGHPCWSLSSSCPPPPLSLNLHCSLPLASLSLTPASHPAPAHPQGHFLAGPRCYSQGPRATSFVAKSGLFSSLPNPLPYLGGLVIHSGLPVIRVLGKEMRPRNSGAEPPTAREMLTHSQCILTRGNSQQSQRAVPRLPRAPLSVLLQAWN